MENNYCLLLECRLIAIIYRTNFMSNIFEIIKFIRYGYIFFDFKKLIHVNSTFKKLSFITCFRPLVKRLKTNLLLRLKTESVMFNTPKFLYISYYFYYVYLRQLPLRKHFVYPFRLDIQRITGYE